MLTTPKKCKQIHDWPNHQRAQNSRTNSSTRWIGQTRVDNRQPMKASCSDNPLTLRILVVSNLHKQYAPIATSKISNSLPQPQITLSNFFLPLNTNSTHPHTHFQQLAEDLKENLSVPGDYALFVLLKQFFNVDIYNSQKFKSTKQKNLFAPTSLHPRSCT